MRGWSFAKQFVPLVFPHSVIWQIFSCLVSGIGAFLTIALVYQKAPLSVFADFIVLSTAIGLLFFVFGFGYKQLIFRQRQSAKRTYIYTLSITHAFCFCALLVAIYSALFFILPLRSEFLVVILGGLILATFENSSAYLRGAQEFRLDAKIKVGSRIISLIFLGVAYVTLEKFTLSQSIILWLLSPFFFSIIFFVIFRLPALSWSFTKPTIRTALILMSIEVLSIAYFKIDIFLIRMFGGGDAETANYGLIVKGLEMMLFVLSPIALIFVKQLEKWGSNYQTSLSLFATVMCLTSLLGMFLFGIYALFIASFAHKLLPSLGFLASPYALLLISCLVFIIPNLILAQLAINFFLEKRYTKICAGLLIVNALGNLILIPQFGNSGAAFMTLVCEGLLFFLLLRLFWDGRLISSPELE